MAAPSSSLTATRVRLSGKRYFSPFVRRRRRGLRPSFGGDERPSKAGGRPCSAAASLLPGLRPPPPRRGPLATSELVTAATSARTRPPLTRSTISSPSEGDASMMHAARTVLTRRSITRRRNRAP